MKNTQLTLGDVLRPLMDFSTKLLSKDGSEWLRAFKRFLRKENPWKSQLLELVGNILLPATPKFVAKDHFTMNSNAVELVWITGSFDKHFLSKVEDPQEEVELRVSRLKIPSLDAPILAELGDKKETTLANIWKLLKKQPGGESGTLLTNGYANIFYVRDVEDVLRAVYVDWGSDGWRVDAISVADPGVWLGGDQVFSRNS